MKGFIFFCLLIISSWNAIAQVDFTATASRTRIAVNERLRIEFKMNVDGDNFTPPNFVGFQVVAGPSQAVSQNWVNGQSSMTKSYTYILKPTKTGKVTIAQAVMTYDGNEYKTIPQVINVTGAVEQPKDVDDNSIRVDDSIHLVAEVSNSNPYLNEAIRVVYKIYVANQTGVTGWNELDSPKYRDFWSQNIDNRNQQVKNGTYNGEPYRYLVLREAILYPQKTGKLEIEPLTLDVQVQIPTNKRDFFGRPYMTTTSKTVSAGKREIVVKNLPAVGRPASFTGAVGDFDFKVETDRAQLDAGESLTASITASGSGNLKLMELPKLKAPQSLEVYNPERNNKVSTNINGMRGSITDSYTIVPQFGGKYVIPPVEFSYFDPKKEQYVTKNSGEMLLMVEGDAPTTANATTTTSTNNGDRNIIQNNAQFAFIKTSTQLIDQEKTYFFNSTTYWSILGGSFLLLPLVLLFRKQQEKRSADVIGNRVRTANKLSKKYLSTAKKNIGNHELFYVSLEKSLHNYLRSKLRIQTADMSKDKVELLLAERGAQDETRKDFVELLASCEFARYTPSSNATMKEDYEKAGRVLNDIDKQLKK
ncbi:oxygen tolerance protein BatD [Nonlabens dokdonensis]|uniref:BatD protein n=2 Tax=Nonlabens dokdonensis TaxID=328515 RepID=L7W7Y4_NONDD|nr:BatD family protein [Nonlabens dokdonensis]AGC76274.1 BatD protein [Nonlabens dokdonensis DSW-6]PZX43936.1 oxygen tolerance protein BatD [Nonlabens dokdonensis]